MRNVTSSALKGSSKVLTSPPQLLDQILLDPLPPTSSSPNESDWDDQPTSTPQTSSNPIECLKEGEVLISLSPSQEKNLYGLGSDEDEDDLTAMNPDEMELAYVAPWEKTVIPSAVDRLWNGYAEGQEEGSQRGQNLWSEEPPPDPAAGQLMCPSHGKLWKKGICSEMLKLVREEERRKREAERGGKRGEFCSTSFRCFAFSFRFFSLCSSGFDFDVVFFFVTGFPLCGFCFRFCLRGFGFSRLCFSWLLLHLF